METIIPKSRRWHNRARVHAKLIDGILGYYVSQWGAGRGNSGPQGKRKQRFYQDRFGQRPVTRRK